MEEGRQGSADKEKKEYKA